MLKTGFLHLVFLQTKNNKKNYCFLLHCNYFYLSLLNIINFINFRKMIDLDLKINYLVAKHGKLVLAEKIGISYPYLQKLLINLDLITIGQLNIIEKLYNELRNE